MSALVVAPLSSSSTRAEYEWRAMFPQSSTVSTAAPELHVTKVRSALRVLPTTSEQLTVLQAFFALSKTQLAQVCGVQRQTIYDWFAGNFEAEGNNASRLAKLFAIARDASASGVPSLSARDLTRTLSDGATVLSYLVADDLSTRSIRAVIAALQESGEATRTNTAAAARERLGWKPTAHETAQRNLEANLDDFVDG